jgi:hypothetical protein
MCCLILAALLAFPAVADETPYARGWERCASIDLALQAAERRLNDLTPHRALEEYESSDAQQAYNAVWDLQAGVSACQNHIDREALDRRRYDRAIERLTILDKKD